MPRKATPRRTADAGGGEDDEDRRGGEEEEEDDQHVLIYVKIAETVAREPHARHDLHSERAGEGPACWKLSAVLLANDTFMHTATWQHAAVWEHVPEHLRNRRCFMRQAVRRDGLPLEYATSSAVMSTRVGLVTSFLDHF